VRGIIKAKNFGSNKYIYRKYIKIYREGQKLKRRENYKSYKIYRHRSESNLNSANIEEKNQKRIAQ
jgi:hypothetical protein